MEYMAAIGFHGSTVAVMVSMTNTMVAICFRAEFCVSNTFSSQAKSWITRVASGRPRSERERFDALSRWRLSPLFRCSLRGDGHGNAQDANGSTKGKTVRRPDLVPPFTEPNDGGRF